ncbi:MAG: hypothetical protein Q8L77_14595 [Nitrospirota bacterium]|nr:hypothetical protein [Nitrospirota bacterium]
MKHKCLERRIDQLADASQCREVTIELGRCDTQAAYERAFAEAWMQVPAGAVVSCFMGDGDDPDEQWEGFMTGRSLMPHNIIGFYLKSAVAE